MNPLNFVGFNIGSLLIWFFAVVLIFLLIRELVTWYWKINKIVNLLEQIEKNTRKESTSIKIEGASKATHEQGLFGKDL